MASVAAKILHCNKPQVWSMREQAMVVMTWRSELMMTRLLRGSLSGFVPWRLLPKAARSISVYQLIPLLHTLQTLVV